MPGMMNTILNLGLNDKTTEAWPREAAIRVLPTTATGASFRCSAKWRWTSMEKFDHIFDSRKAKVKAKLDTDLNAEDLQAIIAEYKKLVRRKPASRFRKTRVNSSPCRASACSAAGGTPRPSTTARWKRYPDEIGTAANVQAMVFGNMGDTSAPASASRATRGSGEKVFYGEFLMNAQGEDVVAGIRTPQPIADLESSAGRLSPAARNHHRVSRSITRTCRTSSSPFRKASSTCCRPAMATHWSGGGAHRRGDGGRRHDPEEEAVMRVAP